MIVTKIEQQKNKDRYSVFLDGDFSFGINSSTLLSYRNIRVGAELSEREIAEISLSDEKESAYKRAFSYVAKSERAEREVINKLKKLLYSDEAIESALIRLRELNLVNDRRYVNLYLSSNAGKGRIRLRHELANKGIERSIIDEELAKALPEEDEQHEADELALKFYERTKDRNKTVRRLLSRGFTYSTIERALSKVNCGDEDDF